MSSCPRCGTSLPVSVLVCTACCQPLVDPVPEATPGWIDLVALESGDSAQPHPQAEVPTAAPKPTVDHHPRLASAGVGNGLGLTTNRGAGFNPMRISTTPPPPNRFLAADRRQVSRVQSAATPQDLPPIPGVQPTSKWVEPDAE